MDAGWGFASCDCTRYMVLYTEALSGFDCSVIITSKFRFQCSWSRCVNSLMQHLNYSFSPPFLLLLYVCVPVFPLIETTLPEVK